MKLNGREGLKADLMLLMVAMWWGLSYIFIDMCLDDMGVFGLNAYRFIGAFLISAVFLFPKLKGIDKTTLIQAFKMGIFLALSYSFTNLSVTYTTATNVAFLCSLAVIITPVIELVLFKKKAPLRMVVSISMCFVGIIFLTLKNGFSISMDHMLGNIFALLCATAYAFEIVYTGIYVNEKGTDPVKLGVFTLGSTGVIMAVISLATEGIRYPHSYVSLGAVLFLMIFCTGISFVLQPIAQKHTEASHVGLIFSLEPVFASIAAMIIEGYRPVPIELIGQLLMLLAVVIMETKNGNSKEDKSEGSVVERRDELS